jgi:putative DNA methylase
MATVVDGPSGRAYVAPSLEHEDAAKEATPPEDFLDLELPANPRAITTPNYGMGRHRDLYTPRQLEMLRVLSDLVAEGAAKAEADSGGDCEYSRAIATYLALVVDKVVQFNSRLVLWYPKENRQTHTFGRQALSMTWDFAEGNPFAGVGGGIDVAVRTVADALGGVAPEGGDAQVDNRDAANIELETSGPVLVCTDPPYYDNVPYADLSDYFYVWLRRSIGHLHPDFFGTLLTPKRQELIAEPARFGGDRLQARAFFETGMRSVFSRLREIVSDEYPLTVYYAFKQTESVGDGAAVSTGWGTMLTGLLESGFSITGTWPTRTERGGRLRDTGSNALASSIVLVCRPRPLDAPLATRKEFAAALRAELPEALRRLQSGSIAPVDLAQAAIGPGMAVFSRYSKVLEADGKPMRVGNALAQINSALDELLAEQEADFDADTRWCIAWFEQYGTEEGPFGVAETLSRAKNTAINGLINAGVINSRGGKVRLLNRSEFEVTWDPTTDARLTVWEVTQHLIARHQTDGEEVAADLLRRVGSGLAEAARELAYRLFAICERKGWAQEALAYNALVSAWPEITRLAAQAPEARAVGEQEEMEV